MNPPPPLGVSELFTLPTITLMIVITFFMQASAIAFNSLMVKEYKGVREAFLATISLALGFVIILFHGSVNGAIVGFSSNILIITGNVLVYLAVCRFTGTPINRVLIYGIVPLGYVVMLVLALLPKGIPLILITQLMNVPLNIFAAFTLFRAENRRYRLGMYLTALPLFTYGLISLTRIITGIMFPAEFRVGPTISNIFDVLSQYVLSYLWTAGFILMISQRLQSDLNDLALNDVLTRVRNRRAMQGLLDFEMTRVQKEVKDFSIALLDIDHFKHVNDTYGHDAGDQVLLWVAQSLQSSLRVQDVIARWGGEEFLILLPDTSMEEAMQITERARAAMEKEVVANMSAPIHITFSAGVANSFKNRSVDQICKIADQALYIAKQTRNRVVSQDEIPLAE